MSDSKPPSDMASREARITLPEIAIPVQFTVRIYYREPTYAQHRGLDAPTYSVAYVVTAFEPRDAEALGRRRFAEACQQGGVGWVREITRVECVVGDATRA